MLEGRPQRLMPKVKRLSPLVCTQFTAAPQELFGRPAIMAQEPIKQIHCSSLSAHRQAGVNEYHTIMPNLL
jgi:hypothetical protein